MPVDKLKPNDPRVQSLTANVRGKTYKYILAKPEGTQRGTALLVHGFPDLGFGWRNQVPLLTSMGLQVIVPDMLGYGGTDAPQELALYSIKSVCDDLAELVRQVIGNDETIVLGGHDWGGAVVWRFALWHPEMLKAVFSVCTPYVGPAPQFYEYEDMVKVLPNFRYQIQLASPDVEREIGSDPDKIRGLLSGMYGGLGPEGERVFTTDHGVHFDQLSRMGKSPLLDEEEIEFYVSQYARNGMRGPVNWYRTRKINFEEERVLLKDGEQPTIKAPSLMIVSTGDVALPPRMADAMDKHFVSLKKTTVDGTHWALWDATEKVNADIGQFVEGVLNGTVKASI
ncbi:hypothetical protein VMCG_00756 [Cytospora schulzeri]|uniref:AB hydrolase-1 domain-containing protein n=1 Tax=Cytospora schulzeri TaxID=448051 RepID=A0A423X8K5_9PEZI|nr:hypothetical protein VMCG_00756 [Valsa malicola]